MTRRRAERNPKRAGRGPWAWGLGLPLALALALALFVAGWLAGRGCGARDESTAPTPAGSPAAERVEVQLRLDAAAVTLLPEGGLELPRLEPLDASSPVPGEAGSPPSQPLTPP